MSVACNQEKINLKQININIEEEGNSKLSISVKEIQNENLNRKNSIKDACSEQK